MAEDREQQLYRDIAFLTEELPKLQNKNKALKAELKKAFNRIDNLELMAFQDQISNLDALVKELKDTILDTQRFLARFNIIFEANHSYSMLEKRKPLVAKNLFSQWVANATKANSNATTGPNPLSVADKYSDECYKQLDELGVSYTKIT